MENTVTATLRKYSDIIKEADIQDWTPESGVDDSAVSDATGFGNDSEEGNEFSQEEDMLEQAIESSDPVADLAVYLVDKSEINGSAGIIGGLRTWLKDNNYELVPSGGLTDREGKV